MMKKILLALALASASSLFAATGNYADWFTATPDAEPAWAWTGEDGSIITNTAATVPYWEIDADVTKAEDPAEATIFTPTGPAPQDNTVTVLDISTTFDAMYDMTTEEGHPEVYIGEDQPLPPPQGSLGALVIGSTTNAPEGVVVSSNFYAWVWTGVDPNDNNKKTGTWFPLYGADIPHSLTGDVVNVRIELLYMGGVDKLRYSIGSGSPLAFTTLTNATGVSLFDFTRGDSANIAKVQFSGCGKVSGIAADVRSTEKFDGTEVPVDGDHKAGADDNPYLISSADTFLELRIAGQRGSGNWFKLMGNFDLKGWNPIISSDDGDSVNIYGENKTITVDLAGDSFFGKLVNSTIQDLTIVANNASDNTNRVAVFASECSVDDFGGVNFVNCTAAGTLHNVNKEDAPVLAGFTLKANVQDGAGDNPTSVTFQNCAVTAELDNGTTDEDEGVKTYAGCYAFVAEVAAGTVASTPDTELSTVNQYESYGTCEDGCTIPDAFNFYTNLVEITTVDEQEVENVLKSFYVVPQITTDPEETPVKYWIAKENAYPFVFAGSGKLTLAYDTQKWTDDVPYSIADNVTLSDSDDYMMVSGESFNDGVAEIVVGPCVAAVYYSEGGVINEDPVGKFSSLEEALGYAAEEIEGQTESGYVVKLCGPVDTVALEENAYVASGVTLDLSERTLSLNARLGLAGNLIAYDYESGEFEDIEFASADGMIVFSTDEDDGYDEEYYYWADAQGTPTLPSLLIEDVLWIGRAIDQDGEANDAATFANVAEGPMTMTWKEDGGHYDFLFGADSDVTINAFTTGPNDSYTLAAGAVVTTGTDIDDDVALETLSAVSGFKVSKQADHTFTTEESQGGVVEINGTQYNTLGEALAEAQPDNVITFLQNVSLTTGGLPVNKQVTLALGEHTLAIGDGSLVINAAVTITKTTGSVAGNILVKAGTGKSLTMANVNPNTLANVTYTGTESGATFNGDVTYNWIGATWSTGPRTYFGGGEGTEATPYVLSSAQHLFDLKDWVADPDNDSTDVYFKQTGAITIDAPWTGIADFKGVYDGDGKALTFALTTQAKRQGFFSKLTGGTVKNLVITWRGFETPAGMSEADEFGGSAVVGDMYGGMVSNIVVNGSGTPIKCAHNASGLVNRTQGSETSVIVDCVNNASFVSYTPTTRTSGKCDGKLAGIIAQADGAGSGGANIIVVRCTNTGAVTYSEGDSPTEGSGGIIGWCGSNQDSTVITGCSSTGAVTDNSGVSGAKMGSIIGFNASSASKLTCEGNTTTLVDVKSCGAVTYAAPGLTFATVEGGVATFVADDEFLAANEQKNYKVMSAGAPVIELESGVWTFDGSLFDTFGAADITASTDANINSIEKTAENKVVTVTVTPLTKDDGVFEVDETVESIPQTGNIKITLEDAKKVSGYGNITSFADITDAADFKAKLNATDAAGVPLWQKLVLGLAADQKPTVKATQDAVTDKVTFSLGTLKSVEQIRNTGAKVKFCLVGAVDGELKEVGETLELPIDSLFQGDDKAKRIKVKVVFEQANQKPKTN